MTSYSDNGYDITYYFCRFEKFLTNTLFTQSFTAVRSQIAELDGGFAPPPTKIGLICKNPYFGHCRIIMRHTVWL